MRIPIVKLQMVMDESVEYLREPLSCPRKAAEWIDKGMIRGSNREHIIVVCCDASVRATCIDEVGRGTVNYCPGTVQEIFKAAVISNATNIFMFHNHPSGDPSPSRADKNATKRIQEAGELLDIRLLDHIIIGRNGTYYSFRENGEITDNFTED